jgi:hypothetical protein
MPSETSIKVPSNSPFSVNFAICHGPVLKLAASKSSASALSEVFHKTWDGYPVEFHAIAWLTIKRFAIQYIDENKPMHFARPIFEV